MSLQPFAFALADALMGAEPGAQPYRAIAFLLGRAGHERAGAVQPKELHRRTRKFAQLVNADLRTQKGLTYDPLEVVEFNSFDAFIAKKPRRGAVWHDAIIVTHGGGEAPAGFSPLITFGAEVFVVDSGGGDLLTAMNAKRPRVEAFRKGFHESADIVLIACSGPATSDHVALYMRELLGTRGEVRFPIKNVDFNARGGLGTPSDPEVPTSRICKLTADEWRILPPKDTLLETLPPPPDSVDVDDFFRD
jgi:hypothetical protein